MEELKQKCFTIAELEQKSTFLSNFACFRDIVEFTVQVTWDCVTGLLDTYRSSPVIFSPVQFTLEQLLELFLALVKVVQSCSDSHQHVHVVSTQQDGPSAPGRAPPPQPASDFLVSRGHLLSSTAFKWCRAAHQTPLSHDNISPPAVQWSYFSNSPVVLSPLSPLLTPPQRVQENQ